MVGMKSSYRGAEKGEQGGEGPVLIRGRMRKLLNASAREERVEVMCNKNAINRCI
jgi:hypothetical protein